MDEARAVLFQDMKERNAAKRGAYAKVRGGGRHVRMPSDTLTRKEKRALNGEVTTVKLGEPMLWHEFLTLPEDIQREYVSGLDEKYEPTNGQLAGMFGVSAITVSRWRSDSGLARPTGKCQPSADKALAWSLFVKGEENASSCDGMGTVEEVPHKDTVEQINALLRALAGSGAKLTIEVTL